jgi:hypothetical protein
MDALQRNRYIYVTVSFATNSTPYHYNQQRRRLHSFYPSYHRLPRQHHAATTLYTPRRIPAQLPSAVRCSRPIKRMIIGLGRGRLQSAHDSDTGVPPIPALFYATTHFILCINIRTMLEQQQTLMCQPTPCSFMQHSLLVLKIVNNKEEITT